MYSAGDVRKRDARITELEMQQLQMVRQLDEAIHGHAISRPLSPEAVWGILLRDVQRIAVKEGTYDFGE